MKQKTNSCFVYITTNNDRTLLETGVTGDMANKLYQLEHEHFYSPKKNNRKHTACIYLLYWEVTTDIPEAISRQREIDSWSFKKKKELIDLSNPEWHFYNEYIHKAISILVFNNPR